MTRATKLDALRLDYGKACDVAMAAPSSRNLSDREFAYARLVECELEAVKSGVRRKAS